MRIGDIDMVPIFPKFGEKLASRIKWNNKPSLVIICVGSEAIKHAESWNKHTAFSALVLRHDQFPHELTWPVKDCLCLIEWGEGPSINTINSVVESLNRHGASKINVTATFHDYDMPYIFLDKSGAWINENPCDGIAA